MLTTSQAQATYLHNLFLYLSSPLAAPVRHLSTHCPDQNHEMHEIWSVDSQETIKVVATRCQILRLKCTKFDFGWGSAPDPAGGAYSAPPNPLAGFKGA